MEGDVVAGVRWCWEGELERAWRRLLWLLSFSMNPSFRGLRGGSARGAVYRLEAEWVYVTRMAEVVEWIHVVESEE
jgi:hypothetical protein